MEKRVFVFDTCFGNRRMINEESSSRFFYFIHFCQFIKIVTVTNIQTS